MKFPNSIYYGNRHILIEEYLNNKINMIILGPPGSGKGTQIDQLKKYGFKQISSSNLIKNYDNSKKNGNLIPDNEINNLIKEEINIIKRGYILDGYPRTINQVNFLANNAKIDLFIELDLDDKSVFERIKGRLICHSCNKSYHKKNCPPLKKGICDICHNKLSVRSDDKPEIIKKRLKLYHKNINDIRNYYKKKKIYHLVKANDIELVTRKIKDLIIKT